MATKKKSKGIKVIIPVWISADNGDIHVTVCESLDDADKFSEKNLRDGGQQCEGEVQTIEVTVDEHGNVIKGFESYEDDEDESDEG